MKKPKKTSPYQEQSDPMRDLDIELEGLGDDEDIIELEDIIEMPDRPIDEDEDLDLDVEIFDVDSDLEPEPRKPAQKASRPLPKETSREIESEEKDLTESLGGEAEEDETLFEPSAPGEPRTPPVGGTEPQVFEEEEEEDESLLDEFMDEPLAPETGIRREEKVDLKARAAAAMKVAEEGRSVESGVAASDEPSAQAEEAAPASASAAPPPDLAQTAEELIGRIESRLQEHIRIVVESRLPNLVRSIINEEIDKLKKELAETGE